MFKLLYPIRLLLLLLTGVFAWTPAVNNMYQFLELDFKDTYVIKSIKTQGLRNSREFVSRYNLQYSDDGDSWKVFRNSRGLAKVDFFYFTFASHCPNLFNIFSLIWPKH